MDWYKIAFPEDLLSAFSKTPLRVGREQQVALRQTLSAIHFQDAALFSWLIWRERR